MAPSGSHDAGGDAPAPIPGICGIDSHDLGDILDRVPFGSVIVDPKGIVTFLSEPYAKFLGIRREAAIGCHVSDVIENSQMHVVVQTGAVEIGQQRVHGQDLVVPRIPIRDERGQIVGAFGQVMFEVRELRDLVRRLKILESKVEYYDGDLIDVSHLPFAEAGPAAPASGTGQLRRRLRDEEHDALEEALTQAKGNKAKAARLLGIHRTSLYKKLDRKA